MKVLVDTSAWIEYLRGGADELDGLLREGRVLVHSTVIGEMSCGNIKGRSKFLSELKLLPKAQEAGLEEVLELIEGNRLFGKGLGFADVQILGSALISGAKIFSFDKALISAAKDLDAFF